MASMVCRFFVLSFLFVSSISRHKLFHIIRRTIHNFRSYQIISYFNLYHIIAVIQLYLFTLYNIYAVRLCSVPLIWLTGFSQRPYKKKNKPSVFEPKEARKLGHWTAPHLRCARNEKFPELSNSGIEIGACGSWWIIGRMIILQKSEEKWSLEALKPGNMSGVVL